MNKRPFDVVERSDLMPLCPHCGKVLGFGQSRMI